MNEIIDFSKVLPKGFDEETRDEKAFRLVDEYLIKTSSIRKRTEQLEDEYFKLEAELKSANGFFQKLSLNRKISINRDLRNTLYKLWAGQI